LYGTACTEYYPSPIVGPWCQPATDQCGSNVPSNCIVDPDVRLKGKTCEKYLAKKTNKKCKKIIKDVLVADTCPLICKRFCPPCQNKSGKIKLDNDEKI